MFLNIYEIANNFSELASIISGRFYKHGYAPQKVAVPYATWYYINVSPHNCLSDAPPSDRYTIHVDCWSDDSAEVVELAKAVRDCFEANGYMIAAPIDVRDLVTMRYRIGLQFSIHSQR